MTINEIKKHLKDKKLIIGTNRTLKNLKLGKLETIFITSNCPQKLQNEIERYSKLTNTKIEKLNVPNEELGVVCKKQYSISIIGLLK